MQETLFDKIWQLNLVKAETLEHPAILFVGLHLLHDISSAQAFTFLERLGRRVRRPDLTLAMADHCAPTEMDLDGRRIFKDQETFSQIETMEKYCDKHGISCFNLSHPYQGIVHVVAPELGLSQPGQIIVCGDSHTATHGAFGALAFGIGSSEVAHVLASQCILQRKPKNLCIQVNGSLAKNVTPKDLALYIMNQLGAAGGKSFAIEYQGSTIRALTMEQRMTLCNMTIEAGSRFGLIAPDEVTWSYLNDRTKYRSSNQALANELCSDKDAKWDKILRIEAAEIRPMMSWGTNPSMSIPLGESIPVAQSAGENSALRYMGWQANEQTMGRSVDHVFIGSCTNGRISDLRSAAAVMQNMKISKQTRCLIVPASKLVKKEAEDEGLDKIFRQAGAIWGEPSCSLCNAMNGDVIKSGQLCVSTSNRNFEGRQGPGSRTILVSPVSAAQIAIKGHL